MKIIPLTLGMVSVVDDEDFEYLSQWSWRAGKHSGKFYAVRTQYFSKKGCRIVFMHRAILNAKEDENIDHKNRNSLDNQRSNLRFCTDGQNMANSKLPSDNTSGFKGVSRSRKKWKARVRQKQIGTFSDIREAAEAYDRAATEIFGEFACTNRQLGLLN